jgi:DNA-3-methyladenine glycosylase I
VAISRPPPTVVHGTNGEIASPFFEGLAVNAAPGRCPWAEGSDAMRRYHDEEWGAPEHDDRRLFELLTLEGAQAGLSWSTVLARREGYRRAFDGFDFEKVALYGEAEVERLMADAGIIRNRQKVLATITNAHGVLAVRAEFGSFGAYVWRFVEGAPRVGAYRSLSEVPAFTSESQAMSRDLRRRGFRFVGPTICYAFMQAAGLANDHLVGCFRFEELAKATGE